ncbi:hypothetical protein B0H16DRAFT_1740969 [Mycena metata]|uniref:F-box domain-containing protein n=1 Tax=Mycena metata TaxID=1033252 RepID=A0AAD7HBT4_9AGAR|nr:hypothetical protein B0H16DRAFT_1740969 [Mycena metata]
MSPLVCMSRNIAYGFEGSTRHLRTVLLPNELVLLILYFALPKAKTVESLALMQLHRLSLLGVCRQWRNCVVGTPAFWDAVYIPWPACSSVVHTWSQRSDLNALRIHIDFTRAHGADFRLCFRQLESMLHRCWLLSLTVDFETSAGPLYSAFATSTFPLLKRLLLQAPTISHSTNFITMTPFASVIQSMYLSSCPIQWNTSAVFVALTTLAISNTTMSYAPARNDFATLCKGAPALVRLSFVNVRCMNTGTNVGWFPYAKLVHLRHLRVSFLPGVDGNHMALQLVCLDAPNLSTLYLDADPNHLHQMVVDRPRFLEHTKELRLNLRSSQCHLNGFFDLLPALIRLDILHRHTPIFKALAPHNGLPGLCPLLQTMSVDCGPDLAHHFLFRRLLGGIPLLRLYYKETDSGVWAAWINGQPAKLDKLTVENWNGYCDDAWSQRSMHIVENSTY